MQGSTSEVAHGQCRVSLWLDATPEQVWRIWADPLRIPEWQTGSPVIEDVDGPVGRTGSSYVSRRGRLVATARVLNADPPNELVTTTGAYLGMQMDVISQLHGGSGGTDLHFLVTTRWPRGRRLLGRVIELAVLNGREQRKELAYFKELVETEATP